MHVDLRPNSARHPRKPLVARGGIARTFGSLGGFLALTFLCSGAYLFADAFSNPLAAESAGLIGGAVIITLATVLLFYMFHSSKPTRFRVRNSYEKSGRFHYERKGMEITSYTEAQQKLSVPSLQQDLPFHASACDADYTETALKAFQARGMAGK